jgi:hypothetical protein
MPSVRDGRAEVGVSFDDWYHGRAPGQLAGAMPKLLKALGATIPPLDRVSDDSPAYARVDWGRWVADCPCGGASLVWLAGPHLAFCASCANADLGGQWRRVVVPDDAVGIASALDGAAPNRQQWAPEAEG